MSEKLESNQLDPSENPPPKAPDNSPAFPAADLDQIGTRMEETAAEIEPEYVAKLERELADDMGVSESFQNGDPAPKEEEIIRDKTGKIFDPAICRADEKGKPIYTKTGLFKLKDGKKRTQLKKTIRVPRQPKPPVEELPPSPPEVLPPDDAEITAETIDNLYWSGMGLFGAEKMDQVSETAKEQMAIGFRSMDNPPKIPWWVGVAAIYGSATAAIMNTEQAKPMLTRLKDKGILLFAKLRGLKRGPVEA